VLDQSSSNTWRLSVNVGDLVRIKEYCRQGGCLAVIIEEWSVAVKVLNLETGGVKPALKNNLELVSESR